uniref:CARDB domain-containing protein n=1 Tax=Candidatus Electronema sp. TaxID=2698783 RepID=UPI004056B434
MNAIKYFLSGLILLLSTNLAFAGCGYISFSSLVSGGPGTSTPPTEPPTSGKLPDFITNKVTMAKENGKGERYTWKVNETAWVHAWVDNIGKANWEGKKDKIKVPFYLSKGTKEDPHSEWVRVGREEIKKKNVEVKDKPKHEKIAFNIPQWAAAGYIYPGRTYNFVVCADRPKDQDNGDGDVKEIHKSNNCSTPAVFYVDYGPARNVDVMASNLALAGGKSSLQAGEAYGFQADISNIGTEYPWNGCRTNYEIKGPGTGGVWQKVADEGSTVSQLGPNSTHVEVIDESRGLKAPAVGGDYVFRACADYEQAIPETDESNNCTAELPVTVEAPLPPPPPPSVTPRIVITNPTHTDEWRSSSTEHDIRWERYDFPTPGNVKVEYSLDGGATWLLIDDSTTNDEKKHWEDMCDFHTVDTHHAYIRITSLEYPGVVAVSDEFSIDHAAECK